MTLQLVSRRVFIVSIFWSIFGVTNKTNKEKKNDYMETKQHVTKRAMGHQEKQRRNLKIP